VKSVINEECLEEEASTILKVEIENILFERQKQMQQEESDRTQDTNDVQGLAS